MQRELMQRNTPAAEPDRRRSSEGVGASVRQPLVGKDFAQQEQVLTPVQRRSVVQLKPDPHHRKPNDDGAPTSDAKAPHEAAAPERVAAPSTETQLAAVPARARANAALRELSAKETGYSRDLAEWQRANWTFFLGKCGGTPTVDLSQARQLSIALAKSAEQSVSGIGEVAGKVADGTLGNGVGAVAGAGVGQAEVLAGAHMMADAIVGQSSPIAPAVQRIFSFLSKGVGGFLSGVFVGLAFDLIRGALSRSSGDEKAAAAATEKTSVIALAVQGHLAAAQKASDETWAQRANEFGACIDGECDVATLDALASSFRASAAGLLAPSVADLSIGYALLEQWVLQHAGDEEGPSDVDTNREGWHLGADALDRDVGNGKTYPAQNGYKRKDGNILKPTLFEDQCKLAWSRLGLDPQLGLASLKAAFAARVKDHGPSSSERAIPELDDWSYDYSEPRSLALWNERVAPHANHQTKPIAPKALDPNGWTTRVATHLVEEDGTFFVDQHRYELVNALGQSVYKWSESPD